MSNYSRTTELISAANNSAGASQEQFNKTLEGLDAKLEQLKAAWQEFVMGLANNDAIKAVVDLLTGLLNTINSLVNGLSGSSGISKAISSFFVAFSTFKLGGAIFGKTPVGEKVTSRIGALVGITPDSAKAAGLETSRSFGVAFRDGLSTTFKKAKGIDKKTLKNFLGIGKTNVLQKLDYKAFSGSLNAQITQYEKNIADTQRLLANAKNNSASEGYITGLQGHLDGLEAKLDNFKAHSGEIFTAFEKGGVTAAKAVADQYGISLNVAAEEVETFKEKTTVSLQTVTKTTLALGMAFNGLASIGEKLGWSENFNLALRTIGNTLMTLPIFLTFVTKAFQKFGVDLTTTFLNIPIIGWIAIAITGITTLITLINKWVKDNSAEEKLKRAKEAADKAAEAAENAKEAYENLNTSLTELGDKYEELEKLTKGTQEWKDAIQQTNTAALELIGNYGELAQYAHWENGVLMIDTDSSEVQNVLKQRSRTATLNEAVSYSEQVDLLKSQMNVAFSDYKIKASSEEQEEITKKIIDGTIRDGQQLAEALGRKEDLAVDNLFNSLQKLAFQIDIYTQSVNQSAMGLIDTKSYTQEEKNILGRIITSRGYQKLEEEAENESQFGKYTRNMGEKTQMAYVQAAKEYFNESAHLGEKNKIIYTDDEGNEQTVDFRETFVEIQATKKATEAMESFTKAFKGADKKIQDVFLTDRGNLTRGQIEALDLDLIKNFINGDILTSTTAERNDDIGALAKFWNKMGPEGQAMYDSDFKLFLQEIYDNAMVSQENLMVKAEEQLEKVGLSVSSLDTNVLGGKILENYGKKLEEIVGIVGVNGIENINGLLNDFLNKVDESDIPAIMDYINSMDLSNIDNWYDFGDTFLDVAKKAGMSKEELDNFVNSMIVFSNSSKKISSEQIAKSEDLLKEVSGRAETERTFSTEQKDDIIDLNNELKDLFVQTGSDEWTYIGDSMNLLEKAIRENTVALIKTIPKEDEEQYQINSNIDAWLESGQNYTRTIIDPKTGYRLNGAVTPWEQFSHFVGRGEVVLTNNGYDLEDNTNPLYNDFRKAYQEALSKDSVEDMGYFGKLADNSGRMPIFVELFERDPESGKTVIKDKYKDTLDAIFNTFVMETRGATVSGDDLWYHTQQYIPEGGRAYYYETLPTVEEEVESNVGTSQDILTNPELLDLLSLEDLKRIAISELKIGDKIKDKNGNYIDNEEEIRSIIKEVLAGYDASYVENYREQQRIATKQSMWFATSGQDILSTEMSGYEDNSEDGYAAQEAALDALMVGTDGATAAYYNFSKQLEDTNELTEDGRRYLKALAVDTQNFGNKMNSLTEVAENYKDVLTEENRGTQEYSSALAAIAAEMQKTYGLKDLPIDFLIDNMELLEGVIAGQPGKWEELRDKMLSELLGMGDNVNDFVKIVEGLDPTLTITGVFDSSQIIAGLNYLNGQLYGAKEQVEQVKTAMGLMGWTVEYETAYLVSRVHGGYHFMPTIEPTRPKEGFDPISGDWVQAREIQVVKGTTKISNGDNPFANLGNGNGDSEKTDTWENPYDKLYNKVQKLNEQLRIREKLERDYQRLLENSTKTSSDVIQNLWDQVAATEKVYELQEDMLKSRRQQAEEYMAENSDMLKYGYLEFDEEGSVHRRIQYDVIDAVTDPELGEAIEKFISQIEEFADQMDEASDGMEDALDDRLELYKLGEDEYFDLESQILEAIKQQRQDEIDELSAINDSINDANSKLLDSLQSSIDQYRQDRDNERTEEEIEDKQRRLAYLQQDTSGANALEILQLQDEIQQAQEDYTDTLIDQKISELQKQNDEAAEQRQEQIDILQQQLDHDEETGTLAEQVQELMSTADAKNIMELLMGADGYDSMTALGKVKWAEEFEKGFKAAMGWIAVGNSTKAELDKGLLKAGQEITFKVDGKDVTGVVQSDGSVKVGNKTYNGVHRDSNFDWVYDSSSEQAPSPTPTPKPTQPTSPAQKEIPIGDWGVTVAQGAKFKGGATISENVRKAGFDKSHPGGFYVYQKDSADNYLIGNSKSGGYTGWINKKYLTAYKTGGLANFTGPAWLDGTPSKPEVILNQRDSQNFLVLKDVLSTLLAKNGDSTQNGGDNYYDIDISVEKLESDYDVDRVADRIKRLIYEDGQYRNVNVVNKLR